MTNEEINSDADRNLVRYAKNEKTIDCLLGRLSNVSRAFSAFVEASGKSRAKQEQSRALEALDGYDLQEDIGKLGAALMEREMLEKQMENHGFSHMIRRRVQEK